MKTSILNTTIIALAILLSMAQISCSQNKKNKADNDKPVEENLKNEGNKTETVEENSKEEQYKVTFIELGSERCIPCQKMQPIMKSIEEKYPEQVKVVFYDVWTPEGKPYANKYNIKVIPTQVFLDENGKEYHRHKGFFPEEELIKVLKQKGVK